MIANIKIQLGEYLKTIKLFKVNAKLLLANVLFRFIGYGVFSLLFNLYILQIGYDVDFIGYLTALNNIAVALMAIPSGFIIDRFGLKRPLVISYSLFILFTILLAINTNYFSLIIFNIALGFTFSIIRVIRNPFLTKFSTKVERTHLFGFAFGLLMIGSVIGNVIGGYFPKFFKVFTSLTDDITIYRLSLLSGAIISAIGLISILKIRKDNITSSKKLSKRTFKIKFSKLYAKLLLPHLLLSLGAGLVMPFLNVFFKKHLNANVSQIGIIFALGSFITGIASFLVPFVTKRIGKVKSIGILQISSLPFLLMIALIPNLTLVAIFYIVRQVLMNIASPIYTTFVMEAVPDKDKSTISGYIVFIWGLGWAISSSYSGILMKNYGYNFPFFICFVFYLISTITFISFFRRPKKKLRT
ncbi:hypothetical protein ES703_43416 [subsurface metagenome]